MNTKMHPAGRALLFLLAAPSLAGCGQNGGAGGGSGHKGNGPQPVTVQVTQVKLGTIANNVPVTGNIQALEDVQLSAKTTARVAQVTVREGDVVRAGQLIVRQDATDLEANVRQAQANVQAAVANAYSDQAKVAQAITTYKQTVQQAKQNILLARAQLRAAQQNYSKLKGGNRPQQILQAQAQTAQAKANLDNAQTTLQRNQTLFQQGAIAKADLDTATTTYQVDQALYKNALANQSLVVAGYQTQDVAAALAQVQQQQANLQNAIANEQNVSLRRDDITAAQAALRQAQAQVAQAKQSLIYNEQQVAFTSITSPIDGIVAARETEPGQIATVGTNLMRIVNVKTAYFEPTISEEDFSETSVGDPVRVRSDALSGKVYPGKVVAVYPAATTGTRTFSLRVNIPNPRNELRPGMFARGELQNRVDRNVIVIPAAALMAQLQSGLAINASSTGEASNTTLTPDQQVMLVGPNNKAIAQPVKVGLVANNQAEITSGLQPGQTLITEGAGLVQPGQAVSIEGQPGHGHGRHPSETANSGAASS
ncbi:MAG: efflux RND transporter periplasmic adaptor subunit [Armatimonadetes bacterium]|nr:efflux RND transporter periplasmic adaptor subunit [Armatimonadota bacterium]